MSANELNKNDIDIEGILRKIEAINLQYVKQVERVGLEAKKRIQTIIDEAELNATRNK